MKNDLIKETISNLKAVRNNFWTAILLLSGATVTFALNVDSVIKFLLSFGSAILLAIFIAIYRSINNDINSHIKELEEEKR